MRKNMFLFVLRNSDRYPPYAFGGGYILSADLVEYIVENAAKLRRYRAEDVSVGVWLSTLAIQRQD